MTFDNLTDADLIDQLATHTIAIQQAETEVKAVKAELLRRQRESGEMSVTHNGWKSGLKREPFSMAWFKRETGYEDADLPPECFTEKLSMVPDWDRVNAWMVEHHGEPLPTTLTLTFQREKKAA